MASSKKRYMYIEIIPCKHQYLFLKIIFILHGLAITTYAIQSQCKIAKCLATM